MRIKKRLPISEFGSRISILILILLLLPSAYAADFYSFNSSFKPTLTNFIYLIPVTNMTSDFLILGNNCLNITGSRLNGTRCLAPLSITINFICENNNDCFSPDICLKTLVCGIDRQEIEIGEVPLTTARILAMSIPVVLSLFFIGVGIVMALPFVGFFGSIMLMAESWFIASFNPFIAYVMALLSMFLMIFFVFRIKGNTGK